MYICAKTERERRGEYPTKTWIAKIYGFTMKCFRYISHLVRSLPDRCVACYRELQRAPSILECRRACRYGGILSSCFVTRLPSWYALVLQIQRVVAGLQLHGFCSKITRKLLCKMICKLGLGKCVHFPIKTHSKMRKESGPNTRIYAEDPWWEIARCIINELRGPRLGLQVTYCVVLLKGHSRGHA